MAVSVLIVDPDELFRSNLADRLKGESFRVYETGDGDQMSSLLRRRIDVVLLALKGWHEQGLALLREIRALRPTSQVILIGDGESVPLSIAGMRLGAFDEIPTPFDFGHLVRRIREACAAQRRKASTPLARLQDLMVAVTFAEAGEHDTARGVWRHKPADSHRQSR